MHPSPQIVQQAPPGFVSYTRGHFGSEGSAVRAAKKRGPHAIVVHEPASRFYAEAWYVGYIPNYKI